MMSDDRLAAIADLVAASRRRMDPERAFALLRACDELVAEVRRLTPRQTRLDLDAAS